MKLLAKYNRINISVSIIIFLLAGLAFYFTLSFIIINELDDSLSSEQQEIEKYTSMHHQLPEIQNTKEQQITYDSVSLPPVKEQWQSKLSFDNKNADDDGEQIRQLTFPLSINNRKYAITVTKSQKETEDLIQLIIIITLSIIALMLLLNYLINIKILNRLWNPFYETIDRVKEHNITNRLQLDLKRQNIDEFSLLNASLNDMTSRINKEYDSLKQFTENASHEMQTPLAVIRTKTETLLQTNEISETALLQLQAIEDATQKLAKLHQSLLLLTKIENQQFEFAETVNFKEILDRRISERNEIIMAKNLSLICKEENEVVVKFHYHLAEIMITNLINNAIRFTPNGGNIEITLNNESFAVSNTGANGSLDEKQIFQRFYKPGNEKEGTGLGLAIVNEICHLAGFTASYHFIENKHIFNINFNRQ